MLRVQVLAFEFRQPTNLKNDFERRPNFSFEYLCKLRDISQNHPRVDIVPLIKRKYYTARVLSLSLRCVC